MTPSPKPGVVLVVDDTPANLEVLVEALADSDHEVLVATDGEQALERVRRTPPDLILLDVMMPGIDGFETCERLQQDEASRDIPVIFMTALSDTVDKVRGFSVGAVDYITKPIQYEEVLARIDTHLTLRRLRRELEHANEGLEEQVSERTSELREALDEVQRLKGRLEAENVYLQEEIGLTHDFEGIVSCSDAYAAVLREVAQVASTAATVLITGETGTGKELLARAVHSRSPRGDRPLVKVNCAALPENLIESELFGHEKGAFTGAAARKTGRFELADGGTLFLDEAGELPVDLQSKLLRVLQEGEFERLGSNDTLRVDVRLIAATNRDLEREVAEGRFREDLFYRLAVFPIRSLPLRERRDDIPLLVRHFVARFAADNGRAVDSVPAAVMARLVAHDWPGNVRELQNIVERAVIVSPGRQLELGEWLSGPASASPTAAPSTAGADSPATLEDSERTHILRVLERTGWRVRGDGGAAEILDVKPTTLEARMKRLGIQRG